MSDLHEKTSAAAEQPRFLGLYLKWIATRLLARANCAGQAAVVHAIGGVPQWLATFDSAAENLDFLGAASGGVRGGEVFILLWTEIFIVAITKDCFEDVLTMSHAFSEFPERPRSVQEMRGDKNRFDGSPVNSVSMADITREDYWRDRPLVKKIFLHDHAQSRSPLSLAGAGPLATNRQTVRRTRGPKRQAKWSGLFKGAVSHFASVLMGPYRRLTEVY
ncbi:hypothetical protein CA85_13780 [Allorhodopirellula solitaria]|uniref:Uncharacterized protein n=1 Tax=Allorhodopirellula solitaria TaxID=2527987 RepID=A0A5C5YB39_9BACT|nr:hypothetical protein CA85_13780 [Allorhodopirellula solitaria]